MKRPTKLLTALLALFIAFPSLKAGNMQVYTAGDLPTSAGTFVAPDFFGGAGWSYRSRTMDPAKKDTAFFPNVLGVTDGVAYGIEISKTQDDPGNIFLSLNLHSCDSIIVAGWGTGGRGILVTNSANTDSSWKGASSYNLIQVPVKVGTDSPVEIKITPTGKDTKNSTSNGGTWITRIVVFAKEGSEVTQYYLSNPGFESPDTTLLVTTKNSGIWIPKGWTVDYPTFNEWDQGIVTSLNDAGGSALPLIAQEGSNFYYGRLRWATNLISLKQDMINPPAGYNVVSMEVASPDGYKAQLAVSTDADTVTESPTGTGWETIDLVFAGEEGKNATFSATASSASGAAQNRMFLDDARMVAYGTNFPPSVLDQRTALIAEANALYGDGSGEGAAALQEAINTFEAVPTTCALGPAETMMAALVALQTAGAELQAAMYDFNVANASPTNPMDLTSKVVNPSANQGRTGWNWSFSSAVQNQGIGTDALFTKATPPYFEAWTPAANKPMTGRIYQIITDLPNGKYELTVAAQGKGGATDNLHVYANDALSGIFVDTVITVPFMVTAGTAEIGIKAEAADVNWIAIDEIHLSYLGFDPAAMIDALNAQIAEADSLLTLKMKESVATELTNARTNAAAAVAASPAVKSQLEAAGAEMAAALPAANASIAGYATLKAAIEASEAKYNAEAPGAADFRAAIDAAQAAWDAAKIDPAVQITALAVANNAFDFAAASETNPVVTNLVVNPTFDTNTLGWSTTTGANNTGIASNQQGDFTVPFWENWSPNNFTGKMYQVIENVPNGDYLLKAAVFCNNGGSGLYLYANDDKVLANTTAPTYHEVMTRVTNNRLEIGIVMEEATNNWVGIDNVSLTYYNFYPSFTKTATGAMVKTTKELLDALKYNDYAIGDIIIELQDCADESGIYMIGTGTAFPQTGGDLTVKAAEGAKPQIWGSFSSTNGMKVNNITFEGLHWNGGDSTLPGFNAEAYQPFGILRADSVLGDYTVRNCTFENLDYQRIFRSNNCAGAVVKKVVFEYNDFDNMGWNRPAGSHGQTFIQMVNSNNYEMDHFVFRENLVMNFHGNQLFNMPRKGTTADSAEVNFSVTIENNTFYRLGGHGNSERNFLEYNQNLGGLNGVININNNVIYDRWSGEKFPQSKLALFTPAEGQNLTVNILNNFFYPDTVVTKDPVYTPEDTTYYPNLRLDPNIDHNRNDLFLSDFPGMVLDPAEPLSKKSCPLYTAGTEGTYVGALCTYYEPAFIEQPTGAIVKNLQELTEALAYTEYESADITIELMNSTDEGGIYLLGSSGFVFPQTGGDLTIKAAEGAKPQIWGSFSSTNGMKVNNITFEGLHWNGGDSTLPGFNAEAYQPFGILRADSVLGDYTVRNCTFENLDYQRIFRSNNCAGAVVKKVVFEYNDFDNMGWNRPAGSHGQTFIQMVNSNNYEMDHFVFRENLVMNFHGNQLFNMPRKGTTADSAEVNFSVTIENNTFYRLGGHGNSERNFLEYNQNLGGLNGVININNNVIYDRWSGEKFPQSKLALFTPAEGQNLTVNILNNFFYPDTVVTKDPVYTPEDTTYYPNLRLDPVIDHNRNDLFLSDFPGLVLDPGELISYKSPLFTAGTEGTYVGSLSSYYVPGFIEQPTGAIVKNLAELTEALAYTDYESADITIELMNCTDEGGVYLLGNSGFAFPQTGGDLTIKNAEGQNPVLAGRLTSNNGVKAATLLYEGLEFNAQSVYDAYNTDTYSPFYMTGIDSVMVGFNVRNCLFTNLPFKQLILSANKIANYAVIKDFVMEHCVIKDVGVNQDTMAQHSGHMFQLSNKKTYEFDHFTFRNNIVNNWRNSQVFNINRDGTTADSTDVNFVVTIENNLFYKFGGNATNVRNFLEYTKSLGGLTGVININNNIFYERGSQAGFPHAKLTMLLPAPGQSVTLNVLNNLFYPDNVVKDESTPENYPNLRLVGPAETDITFSRNDLFMDSFEGLSKVFRNEARLTISKQSPLFEAGTGGSFIGPEQIYVGNAGTPVIAFLTKQKTMAATAATVENDPVYLMMAADDNFIVDQIVLTDVSATSPVDLDAYDIALVQESFGGGDKILTPAGPLGLAKFDLPVLYNKTYAFKAGRALASGQPGSGAEQQGLSITVDPAQQGNDLFKGLTFADDNTLTLFKAPAMDDGTLGAEKSIKALNYAKEVVLSSENTPIAIPTGVTDAVIFINDLPAGTVVGGETLAERMITVGFNFGAMCADNGTNMTNAAFTIWRNALYMLAGMEVPSDPYDALPQTDGVQKNVVFTMGGNLYVQATEQTNINIYNVMGALVRTVRLEQGLNTIEGLSQGQIYVVKIDSEAIKVVL
ncbi:MAG TPA: hypothetical protein PKX83_05910 [Bacteroidales bacterium]|nr:hypothetical protein [Bacteroidales bacterium]